MRTKFWTEILNGRNRYGDLDVDGRAILARGLKKWVARVRAGFIWFRIWTSDSNEPSGLKTTGNVLVC